MKKPHNFQTNLTENKQNKNKNKTEDIQKEKNRKKIINFSKMKAKMITLMDKKKQKKEAFITKNGIRKLRETRDRSLVVMTITNNGINNSR